MNHQRVAPRIMQEYKELQKSKSSLLTAVPLEDNMHEWHFTIRGPKGTEFEGGIYHGRIILPNEYPHKPPDIIFSTPNGRFEVDKKICLTISSHHPESWQPSWGIRTALLAIIGFMPTRGDGAIASLDWPAEERRALAKRSLAYHCPKCGSHNLTSLPPEDDEQLDLSSISGIELKDKDQQLRDDKETLESQQSESKPTTEIEATQPASQQPQPTALILPTTELQPAVGFGFEAPQSESVIQPQPPSPFLASPKTFYTPYTFQERSDILVSLDKFIIGIFCLLGLIVFRRLV